MALQNMQQDQNMNLVLSSDAKPRLKWNPQLHQKFVHAVAQLGGADSNTEIFDEADGHSWAYIKYRLGKGQQSQSSLDDDQAGKYLHSVLKKAQDTLSGCNASSAEVELAKTELSQLVSMVDSGCPSSSLSMLTEIHGSILRSSEKKPSRGTRSSLESSLTSSESSGRKEGHFQEHETEEITNINPNSPELSLMEMHSHKNSIPAEQGNGRKRSECSLFEGDSVDQPLWKRPKAQRTDQLTRFDFLETLDLNSHYSSNLEFSRKEIDLNSKDVEQSDGI
uniref:MYB-CC type transcription factor LHEQLE-containing domain-containing protein n=1 Tax=Daucus carota subsp. sativus TaxID=79200 RepID=A0A166EB26_DAUCS